MLVSALKIYGGNTIKAFVFSIGEKTTDLCCELMQEYGYEVILYQDDKSLWQKLKRFYTEALDSKDNAFIRIDADIIPNPSVKSLGVDYPELWECAWGFDWYKQDLGAISIHYMPRTIIETCLENVEEALDHNRPESYLWRIPNINKNVYIDETILRGVHGYGQKNHRERIKSLKQSRNQEYDWDLLDRIEAL